MPDDQQLFDEPEPQGSHSGHGDGASSGGRPGEGGFHHVSRRRFLGEVGGAAAAGAAIGVLGTIGVNTLTEGEGGPSRAAGGLPAAGSLGVPSGRAIREAVISLDVNGNNRWVSVRANETLAEVLRVRLGLTGTKIGCDRAECSACTVLVDGVPQNSCSLLAVREEGKKIVTIEGLAKGGQLSPVQQAFVDEMALQCGFCTPGFVMQATALLEKSPQPSEEEVRRVLSGNLCKCGEYPNILTAVLAARKT